MEESKELADNRLIELQKLQQDLQNVHQENNNMKVFLSMYFIAVIYNKSVFLLQPPNSKICLIVDKHTDTHSRSCKSKKYDAQNHYASTLIKPQELLNSRVTFRWSC